MNLDKIKSGVDNRREITWPGTENKVLLRILSRQQLQTATFDAERRFMER